MKISKDKFVIIILLIIVIILSVILVIKSRNTFSGSTTKTFLSDITNIQSKLSYYIGSTYSETFGVYTNVEIITGTSEKTSSKSNLENIKPIVDTSSKKEKNSKVYYKLNSDVVKQILKINLPTYDGIEWYIQDGQYLKVNFEKQPSWWNDSLNTYMVGNN